MKAKDVENPRMLLHDLRLKQTVVSRTVSAVQDVERVFKQYDTNGEDDFGKCAALSLIYLFGQESVYPSEELNFRDYDKFFDRLDELVFQQGFKYTRTDSSGQFLELLENDDFRGALFCTSQKHGIDHVYAARPTFQIVGEAIEGEIPKYEKRFTVIDIAREGLVENRTLEEMIEHYAEAYVASLESGGFGKVVYVISSS